MIEFDGTIAEAVVSNPFNNLNTLLAAVEAADPAVLDALSNPDADLTVFAPVNEAFAAVPTEILDPILADQGLVTNVLLYHVVDDDVEHMKLEGHRENGRFLWTNNDADLIAQEMPVYPTNYWNPSVLSQTRVLNTLTGEMNRVSIQPHQVLDRDLPEVKQFRYTGDLRLDAWYDISGRWMGMRFKGRDDSTIEYRCRDCPIWRTL